jgi:hypothetical protein
MPHAAQLALAERQRELNGIASYSILAHQVSEGVAGGCTAAKLTSTPSKHVYIVPLRPSHYHYHFHKVFSELNAGQQI